LSAPVDTTTSSFGDPPWGLADCRRELEDLRAAMTTRPVIDQAKGILMARHGVDAEAAFALLSETSQRENVKVRDLAARLTEDVLREQE
jgi:AmiR/NasT family two-component response regulator